MNPIGQNIKVTSSTIGAGGDVTNLSPFRDGGWHEIAPPGDLFGQSPGEMILIRGKLADRVGDHVLLPPDGVVLVISPRTESSYPRPPQSLKHSSNLSTFRNYNQQPRHREIRKTSDSFLIISYGNIINIASVNNVSHIVAGIHIS